jgi:hypothetical protein
MRRNRLSADVTAASAIALLCAAALPAAVVVSTARAYLRAAAGRRSRREACPFENDDDEARPLTREISDVVRESGARLRAFGTILMPMPRQWRGSAIEPGAGPIVLLVAERRVLVGSMASLGHRLARDLDASIHVEPGGIGSDTATRASGVAAHVMALAASAPERAVLLVGHGTGGLVARRAATTLRLPILRVVTLATPHREADEPEGRDHLVDRLDVVNIYSLHDALIVPAERAYLAGAFNVALRDHGHFGLLHGERPYTILCESLADLAPHAAAS